MSDNNVKPGWKTTEFWAMIISAGFGLMLVFGVLTNTQSNTMLAYINNISGGIMTAGGIITYIWSRGKAKKNPDIDYKQLLIDIDALVNKTQKYM